MTIQAYAPKNGGVSRAKVAKLVSIGVPLTLKRVVKNAKGTPKITAPSVPPIETVKLFNRDFK